MNIRQEAKRRTRQKLLRAIVGILHERGHTALTTGRVAEWAGVAQPTFYVHFRDMDDALEQAAELAASEILEGLTGSGAHAGSDDPDERIRAAYRSTLDALLRDARTTELFLRHRRDVQTPFGRRFQEVAEQTRQQLRRQLEPLGSPQGPGAPGSVAHAELTLGMTLGAVEGLLDGRIPDRESAVEALVQLSYSALSG